MAYKPLQRREHNRPLPQARAPSSAARAAAASIGPYVVQWGRGPIPRIEFLRSTQAVNERLGVLWDEGAKEAVGRYLSYNDIMLTHMKKL